MKYDEEIKELDFKHLSFCYREDIKQKVISKDQWLSGFFKNHLGMSHQTAKKYASNHSWKL
jgi:hypothetical protein